MSKNEHSKEYPCYNLTCFLLVPISLLAEEQEEINTMFISDVIALPVINEKGWIKLDFQSRIMYLTGIETVPVFLLLRWVVSKIRRTIPFDKLLFFNV